MGDRHTAKDLNPDVVSIYLQDNPDFLEQYVVRHVPQEHVERWHQIKSSKEKLAESNSTHNINGEYSPTENIQQWKFAVRGERCKLLEKLTKSVYDLQSKSRLLSELAACIAAAVSADSFHLYLVNEKDQNLRLHTPNSASTKLSSECTRKIGPGSTLAAFVAFIKEGMCLSKLKKDDRFPEGLGVVGGSVASVLIQPVINSTGEVIGVIELCRSGSSSSFSEEDQEICSYFLVWGAVMLHSCEMYHNMMRQRKLNDFLLTVTKSIFQDIVSMDTVIMKIMNYAKKLVNADRTSLFLVDNRTKELYARVFDMGEDDNVSAQSTIAKEIRFPMDKGVAGHVASTGEILNITDAYADPRFNRNVDLQTGYKTDTILCMPIYIRGNIIGVVQMVNKVNGVFSKSDEESFETFAVYCGLALHHAKLYEKIRRSEQKYKVALEMLSYHAKAPDEEVQRIRELPQIELKPNLTSYEFSPWHLGVDEKLLHVIHMFKDLFSESRLDEDCLIRFTLTVRKNYRQVPYHNWQHAFSVAHAMFTVVKTNSTQFSALENEGHNIFRHLGSNEYKQVLGDIKHCILSTDLALFFSNRAKLKDIHDNGQFDWGNREHRQLLMANSMTACDLCSMYKPWNLQLELVHVIMEEFWLQGDEEKKTGVQPIPMMDRDKSHQLPQSQVGFLVGICLPCYELLAEVLPATRPMVEGAKENLRKWQELVNKQEEANKEEKEKENKGKEKEKT